MTRPRRAAATVVLVAAVLGLTACAGRAGAGMGEPTATGPAQPAAIATWTAYAGIAPELVYVTDLDGFALQTQSVGVVGDDGMSAYYLSPEGGLVMLTTARVADPSAVPCAALPDATGPNPRCSAERGDVHVLLEGEGVDAATLRAAAEAVRVPREDELAQLFVELPTPAPSPVERGDLPREGDGAPVDPPGLGG